MSTMESRFTCTFKWDVKAATGEVRQAKQSLLWAEESAEKRKVKKSEDLNVMAGHSRVEAAHKRLSEAESRLADHDCSSDPVCAVLQKDENGS